MKYRLELESVCKSFPQPGGNEPVAVLRDLDLSVGEGESLAVTGRSGSGKSTLLNLIAGLDRPDSGVIRVDGVRLEEDDEAALSRFRTKGVGLVFQLHHLLPQCTALENVLLPAYAEGAPRAPGEAVDRASDLLRKVGLGDRMDHRPAQLSGGERQRCAIARALLNEPGLLLADEPTGSLDEASAGLILDLLLEINRDEGVTLIVVTHARELARGMSRVCDLRGGRLVSDAPVPNGGAE